MKSLRRGVSEPEAVEPEPAEVVIGKGRPTPKRRDAAPKRQPVSAPRTRKEASRWNKQQATATKAAAPKLNTAQYREALRRGDPTVLPRRDRGPVRKLARDWVDSHHMVSNFLLVLFIPMLAAAFIRVKALAYVMDAAVIVLLVVFALEWYITGRRIRALAVSRGIEVREGPMVIGLYAGTRAYMPRRFRMPTPVLRPGDQI